QARKHQQAGEENSSFPKSNSHHRFSLCVCRLAQGAKASPSPELRMHGQARSYNFGGNKNAETRWRASPLGARITLGEGPGKLDLLLNCIIAAHWFSKNQTMKLESTKSI